MRGKRGNTNAPKGRSKKIKRSKKFWQQRKTNTISQVETSDSENDDLNESNEYVCPDDEPATEYQKLLETFATVDQSKTTLVSDSEDENEEINSATGKHRLILGSRLNNKFQEGYSWAINVHQVFVNIIFYST